MGTAGQPSTKARDGTKIYFMNQAHFVEQTAHGPHVRLEVVATLVDALRRHVIGRAHYTYHELQNVTS